MKRYIYIYKDKIIYTSDEIENLTFLVVEAQKQFKEVEESKIKYYKHF